MRIYQIDLKIENKKIFDAKKVHSFWRSIKKSIKEQFYKNYKYTDQQKKQDFNVFQYALKFFIINDYEILKISDEKKEINYIVIEDIFKEKIFFIIYSYNEEISVFENKEILEILSGRGIPTDTNFLVDVKSQTIDKKEILKTVISIFLGILFIFVFIQVGVPSLKKNFFKPPPPPPSPTVQRQYTDKEMKDLFIYVFKKATDKAKGILNDASKTEGMIIKYMNINIEKADRQSATMGYKIDVVREFIYPANKTKKVGNTFIKTDSYTEKFQYDAITDKDKIGEYSFNKEECYKSLLPVFEVLQREDDYVVFEGKTFEDISIKSKILFFDFIKYLQEICGFNLEIYNFGFREEGKPYIENFQVTTMESR